ncbi:DUF6049 family protein [Actinoallomurus iriomotensis]|uniref:DUF6049 family protein n=1 Tax=Actinoallomurus iriomotensis TaxID=478107 RepID=UPI0025526906|nr:DUF6049 family protein [Actinoallomurus iriomotensis]
MRRLIALVVPLLLSGAPAFAATPTPAPSSSHARASSHASRASRDRAPTPKSPVDVKLASIRPGGYLRANSTLRVTGRMVNQSESGYQRVSVRLRFSSQPMTSRGELEAYADGKGPDPARAGQPRLVTASLPVGGQQSWSVSLPVRQMGLGTFGVYPISVETLSAAGTVLGHVRTFVTYYPVGIAPQRTKVAWVWPVIDQPHRADDSTFVDDGLERQLGSGGRLSNLVTAAARTTTPVSWLIDPSLVDDATRMGDTDGYRIKGTARPQSVAANDWLRSLHSAVTGAGDHLIATPYADPDVMALAQRGMGDDVKLAAQEGTRTLAAANLGGATPVVAMPPDGLADQPTLSALVAGGSRTVLLSSSVLPDSRGATYTVDPVAHKTVSGTNVKLLAYDDTLRKILGTSTTEPGGTVIAEQRFLAETAMITNEAPQKPRTIVITPPRRWNPSPAFAKAVLNYTAKAPWMQAVPLGAAENTPPAGRAFQAQKGSVLSKNYLRQVRDLRNRIRLFTSIFTPATSGFTLGVARTESSAWNGQSRRGARLRDTLTDELDRDIGKIKVLNDGITMAGKSGRTAITISNGLDHGTVVVRLRAYSQNKTRLRVDSVDRTLQLEPGHKDQVTLDMKASANGIAYINLELLTPDGRPFGTGPHVLHVRTTAYGRTALLITGVSLAVLFVGVAIRVVRRRAERAEESVE